MIHFLTHPFARRADLSAPRARAGARTTARLGAGLAALLALAACTGGAGVPAGGINDPHEAQNRKVHAFNSQLDAALFSSAKEPGDGGGVPQELRTTVANLAGNWALPGVVVNNLLQGDLPDVAANSYRFLVNSTLGFAGLFDPAADFGVAPRDATDFGETLHVWGVPEGAYLELPVLGPSTERDAAGRVVDLFTNPLGYILEPPEKYVGTAARLADKALTRKARAGTVDSILRDSVDSYAQARLIYLQNRRHELGMTTASGTGATGGDPASDPYIDPYSDPYGAPEAPVTSIDPYEDPYVE